MKKLLLLISGIAVIGAMIGGGLAPASGADHADGPSASTTARSPLDISDLYAFSSDQAGKVVLVLNVNSFSLPGDTPTFATDAQFDFKVDNTGDFVADAAYQITFGAPDADLVQDVTVKLATTGADGFGDDGATILTGKTTGNAGQPVVNSEGGRRLFAGLRDDPFFFDLNAFLMGLQFRAPGVNFYTGFNINSIVLEVPAADLGTNPLINAWATTSRGGNQVDRTGKPTLTTVFIARDQKDAYNTTRPSADVARWKPTYVAKLNSLNADPALADALLPDVVNIDTSKPLAYLNGRRLQDDVIDANLQLITGNPAASDNVANDSTFTAGFPFLGAPNPPPLPPRTVNGVATNTAIAAGVQPTTAPPPPGATATRAAGVVRAPDTGTGDGTNSGADSALWIALAFAGAAVVVAGGAVAVRARGK